MRCVSAQEEGIQLIVDDHVLCVDWCTHTDGGFGALQLQLTVQQFLLLLALTEHARAGVRQCAHVLVVDADSAYIPFFQHAIGNVLQNAGVTGHYPVFAGGGQLLNHRQRPLIQQMAEVA